MVRRALSTIRTSASRQPGSKTLVAPSKIQTEWPIVVKPMSRPKNGIAVFALSRLGVPPRAQLVSLITTTFRLVVDGIIRSTVATISERTAFLSKAGRSRYCPSGRTMTKCPCAAFSRTAWNLSSALTAMIVSNVHAAWSPTAVLDAGSLYGFLTIPLRYVGEGCTNMTEHAWRRNFNCAHFPRRSAASDWHSGRTTNAESGDRATLAPEQSRAYMLYGITLKAMRPESTLIQAFKGEQA